MPGGDRTGPMGEGSRTGRGAGFCGGWREPGFTTAPGGRGFRRGWGGGGFGRGSGGGAGRGWGRGWTSGWGRWFGTPPPEPEEEVAKPRGENTGLSTRIQSLEERLARLEKGD
jgi:hypothetical protein